MIRPTINRMKRAIRAPMPPRAYSSPGAVAARDAWCASPNTALGHLLFFADSRTASSALATPPGENRVGPDSLLGCGCEQAARPLQVAPAPHRLPGAQA